MKRTFWLLDLNHETHDGKSSIWLWGITHEGKRILVTDSNYRAYFYLLQSKMQQSRKRNCWPRNMSSSKYSARTPSS